uniref:Imidazole glycerol phosphate synthase hisHF n=1 Tax=Blastobotrys adeninivorans TaxID=409370 RepID=A0A060T2L1_BLAAD
MDPISLNHPSREQMSVVHVIDVDSGNLQSLENALVKLGWQVKVLRNADEMKAAYNDIDRLILPGVGNFGHFMDQVSERNLYQIVSDYIDSGRPLMGICVGLQALLNGSTESPSAKGLGLIDVTLSKFDDADKPVPQIGWNNATVTGSSASLYGINPATKYYFVHSYAAILTPEVKKSIEGWQCAVGKYGTQEFIAALARDNIFLTQFHPEKSGRAGLDVINSFLTGQAHPQVKAPAVATQPGLTRRVIACLDVRTNDQGDLVVTKGDQYDVREKDSGNNVRNLGKPVAVAKRYYEQGADEVTFLNITSFRSCPLADLPMLEVLRETSKSVFVPLTIGGGIRDTVDPATGKTVAALDVASLYFRSGADKVSIGSDAVYAAEAFFARGNKGDGKSPMETISKAYGVQAVVVSVDPKRVYVNSPQDVKHHTFETQFPGPNGEKYVWYQCTVKGGREARDLGAYELAVASQALGAGEILLNCIDKDGTNSGYDLELIRDIKSAVQIPVIASSGAGNPAHFVQVFKETPTDAALGAGMFHREEYTVAEVKDALNKEGLVVRVAN